MTFSSLLFVPADSARKFQKAQGSGADVLIIDMEDSVAPAAKASARQNVKDWLAETNKPRPWKFYVRVNDFSTGLTNQDLEAAVHSGLDGIMLPKCSGGSDVRQLGQMIDPLEAAAGIPHNHIKIIPIATETPQSVFNLGTYAPPHPRLAALTWGAEDLSAEIGALRKQDESGNWTAPFQLVRSMCLMGAASAGVPAIDTLHADFRDDEGHQASCDAARQDGFTGKLAIHPDQVVLINMAFQPTQAEVDLARKVVEAFKLEPDKGAIGIDGKMYDRPHLRLAERVLEKLR